MSNTNLNSAIILRKFQDIFHNKISTSTVDRQYDSSFKSNGVSGKPGTSLKVRKPAQFTIRSGKDVNVQDITQETTTITCSTQEGVDFAFTSEEMTMNIDDLARLVLEPAASRLASRVDSVGLSLYKQVANSVGDFSVDSADDILAAGEKLNNNCAPEDGRIILINPKANRSLVNGLAGAYNNQQIIGTQNKTGLITSNYGFDFYMSQNVNTHTTGTRVNTASQYGLATSSALSTTGTVTLDSAYAVTWKAGDTITLDGIYDVNPEDKSNLGYLKQFTIAEDASTSSTIKILPIPVLSGATQNATGTLNTSGYVNVTGVASTSYGMNLAYVPQAFTLVTADLSIPSGVDMAYRDTMDGISMRFIRYYDGNSDTFVGRFDVYYGWTALRPEWACRIPGSVG